MSSNKLTIEEIVQIVRKRMASTKDDTISHDVLFKIIHPDKPVPKKNTLEHMKWVGKRPKIRVRMNNVQANEGLSARYENIFNSGLILISKDDIAEVMIVKGRRKKKNVTVKAIKDKTRLLKSKDLPKNSRRRIQRALSSDVLGLDVRDRQHLLDTLNKNLNPQLEEEN